MQRTRLLVGTGLLIAVLLAVLVAAPVGAKVKWSGPQLYTVTVADLGEPGQPNWDVWNPSIDGVTLTKATSTGTYWLTFPFSLKTCTFMTTPTYRPVFVVPSEWYRWGGNEDQVQVDVYDPDGTLVDQEFRLLVICP